MFVMRRHERLERNLKVTWQDQELVFNGFTKDICAGGVFIVTSRPVRPRDIIKLELASNGSEPVIHCVGRVIWVNRGQVESFPPGFGVEILDIDSESLENLLSCCDDEKPGPHC